MQSQIIRLKTCAIPGLIEEVRLLSEQRVMHAKVDELYNTVQQLRRVMMKTPSSCIPICRRSPDDIQHGDEIFLCYIKLKQQADKE